MTILRDGIDLACVSDVRRDAGFFHGLRKRLVSSLIVLHWTGGAGNHKAVFSTLKARKLSVHFVVDHDAIWQMADLSAATAHARGYNHTSVGIEIVGRGVSAKWTPGSALETIHGDTHHVIPFTALQMSAAGTLCHELCAILNIPRTVPVESLGLEHKTIDMAGVSGVVGHYHLTRQKIDPGPSIFRSLVANYGFVPT